jgi:hypothetical protein
MQPFQLKSAKLGDLVCSNFYHNAQTICIIVGVPNVNKGERYIALKILHTDDRHMPTIGTVFQQSPHNKNWSPL